MTTSERRLTREALRLGAIGRRLPGATAVTLAHRLPILAGLSPASAAWQTAELWRMTLEKPFAFWQAWLAASTLPWRLWSTWAASLSAPGAPPELALRLTADSLRGMRQSLAPMHAGVAGNARRLTRRAKRSARRTGRGG